MSSTVPRNSAAKRGVTFNLEYCNGDNLKPTLSFSLSHLFLLCSVVLFCWCVNLFFPTESYTSNYYVIRDDFGRGYSGILARISEVIRISNDLYFSFVLATRNLAITEGSLKDSAKNKFEFLLCVYCLKLSFVANKFYH